MGKNSLFALLVFLLALSLYAFTAAPSLFWEDSSAFQLAVSEMGIPHNPSFPAYLLITKLFTLIPFAGSAFMVNLASGLYSALSAMLLFLIASRVGRQIAPESSLVLPAAFLASLLFAVTYAVWVQSVRAEVYTLNLLLTLLLFWLSLRYHLGELAGARYAALFGLVAGLGAANHYLLLGVVATPLIAAVGIRHRTDLVKPRSIALGMLFFLAGLSTYLYLPIRESFQPVLSWGDFSSLASALKSILRLDESYPLVAATAPPFVPNLTATGGYLLRSAGIVASMLAGLGLYHLWRHDRLLCLALFVPLAAIVGVTAWAAEFSLYNLDLLGYLLPAYAILTILMVSGMLLVRELAVNSLHDGEHSARLAADLALTGILAFLVLWQGFTAYPNASKRGFNATNTYAEDVLDEIPPNGLFLAGEDNSFLPALYLQNVERVRPDVIIVSGGALLRSDYRHKLRKRHPHLWYPSDWNDGTFDDSFNRNLVKWCVMNDREHPLAVTLSEWTTGMIPYLDPSGYVYQLTNDTLIPADVLAKADAFYAKQAEVWKDSPDLTTREHFGRSIFNYAVFLLKHGRSDAAAAFAVRAALVDDNNVPLLLNCANLLLAVGHVDEARTVENIIRSLDPHNQQAAVLLSRQHQLSVVEEENE
jgi:hypothetical protein